MTFVLALGNCDQVVQISDRQLTDSDGQPCVLPENKATILSLADARLICGIAGLARAGPFRTGQWILDALLEAASEDHLAHGTIERFTQATTARFREPNIARVSAQHRRLSILFTGYRDVFEAPTLIAALVTNFQDLESGLDEEPWEEFRATYWSCKTCADSDATYIQRIGQWIAMESSDELRARRALEERRPASAIVDLGVGLVRTIAARPGAKGTVGKELSSAVLPAVRPPELARGQLVLGAGFHPVGASHTWRGVNQVASPSDEFSLAIRDPAVEAVDRSSAAPVTVQKVGRNKLCPCGSRKKYKNCHGA